MYTIGQRVHWRHTEGGGGGSGHRANAKTLRPATVLQVSARAVKITVDDRWPGNATWVRLANVQPMTCGANVGERTCRGVARPSGFCELHDPTMRGRPQ